MNTERLTTEERENLPAYLDGELNPSASRALEAKLARSPVAREEAESLKRTWDLLDYLPRPQAPENFTHKTVQRLDTVKIRTQTRKRTWQRLAAATWAAALIGVGVFSFQSVYRWPGKQIAEPGLADLPSLECRDYWPHLEKIDTIDFLKELEHQELFGEL